MRTQWGRGGRSWSTVTSWPLVSAQGGGHFRSDGLFSEDEAKQKKYPFVRNFSLTTSCFVFLERACHRVIKQYCSDLLPLNHNRINDVGHKGRAYPKDVVFFKVKAMCTAPHLLHSQMKKCTCVCFHPLLLHEYLELIYWDKQRAVHF